MGVIVECINADNLPGVIPDHLKPKTGVNYNLNYIYTNPDGSLVFEISELDVSEYGFQGFGAHRFGYRWNSENEIKELIQIGINNSNINSSELFDFVQKL
jgi:hypothetical protein